MSNKENMSYVHHVIIVFILLFFCKILIAILENLLHHLDDLISHAPLHLNRSRSLPVQRGAHSNEVPIVTW